MSDKKYKGLVKSLKKYKIGSDRRYYVGLEISESESLRLVSGVVCQFNIGGKIINCPVCECLLNDDDTVNGVSFIFEDPKNELNWLETIDINLCNSYLYFNVGHDTKKAKEVLDTMVANTDDKIYRRYTKQELWLAYNAAASNEWITFNDFFEKTFADKPATDPSRETFLIHLDAALRICEIPLTVGQVERAVKIYNTVKEHGGKTSIEHLLR
jgi:hypothetical protein